MTATGKADIAGELRAIRQELAYIKEHMVDVDMVLTPDEAGYLDEARRELKAGKTVRLGDVKRSGR